MDAWLLTLIAFSPLLGILALLPVPREQGKLIRTIGMTVPLLPLALSCYLYAAFDLQASGKQFVADVPWISFYHWTIDYDMAVDGLSMPFVVMTAIVGAMAALASVHIRLRLKEYFILLFLLEVGMLGVFMAQNLFLFFLFFELTLVATFFLIGIWGYMEKEKAANSFLIYNGLGSAIMLLAFIGLGLYGGSFDIADLSRQFADPDAAASVEPAVRWGIFLALLLAFGIKLPIVPFHRWMLRVHVQAAPPVVMIHSGVLLKMGAYGLIRFGYGFFPDLVEEFALALVLLGLVNLLYGAALAFVQRDLKMVLAYSSISHMGIVLLGIAALNFEGFSGAVFQSISHGFISALLFFLIGVIYERTRTSYIDELGGLARPMPFASGVLLTGAMASLGLPLTSGFISEFQAFLGLFGSPYRAFAAVGALGLILTAAYLLRAVLRTTFGPTPEKWQRLADVQTVEVIPMMVLVSLILLIGVYPSVLGDPLQNAITDLVGRVEPVSILDLTSRIGG